MPLTERLRTLLDSHHAEYTLTTHPLAFTARGVAAAEHLPPAEVAKTVVIFGDGEYHMLVVPASKIVDFSEVRAALGLSQVRLATETELARLFPDAELGAMPPIGALYALPVYLDTTLAARPTLAFNAGSHREAIHMKTADFREIVQPVIVSLVREPAMRHG
jgi:Ala-tRNA(Pro) deacylase